MPNGGSGGEGFRFSKGDRKGDGQFSAFFIDGISAAGDFKAPVEFGDRAKQIDSTFVLFGLLDSLESEKLFGSVKDDPEYSAKDLTDRSRRVELMSSAKSITHVTLFDNFQDHKKSLASIAD